MPADSRVSKFMLSWKGKLKYMNPRFDWLPATAALQPGACVTAHDPNLELWSGKVIGLMKKTAYSRCLDAQEWCGLQSADNAWVFAGYTVKGTA